MSCPQTRQNYAEQKRQAAGIDKSYLIRTSLGRQKKEHFKRKGPEREMSPWEILFAAVVGVTVINAATHGAAGGSDNAPVIQDSCGVTHYDNGTTYHFKANLTGDDYFDYNGPGENFSISKYCKAGNAGDPPYGYQKFLFGDKVKDKDKAGRAVDPCPDEKVDFKRCYYQGSNVKAEFDAKLVNKTMKDHRQILTFEAEGNVGPPAKNKLAADPYWLALLSMLGASYLARRRRLQHEQEP